MIMKKTDFLFTILFFCLSSIKSQSIMQKKTMFDINFHLISAKEKDSLINTFRGVFDNENSNLDVGDSLFVLNDGRIIYEMTDIKTFLFQNKQEFKSYVDKSVQLGLESTKSRIIIKDEKFIQKRDLYVELFNSTYSLELEPKDIKTLSKVDSILNSINEQDILKFKLSIIAIIGEYISHNCKEAIWKYLNHPSAGKIPILIANGTIIEPVKIFEVQFYDQYKKGKPFNLLRTVQEYVDYYNGK